MLRIGQLAAQAGVSPRALRYYEQQGLLEAERTASGQRVYPAAAVEKVRFFQLMYAAGLTSDNIATLLPCVESGHTDAAQREMLHAQRDRVRARRDKLQAALDRLEGVIEVTASHP
ncbi:MerR family transcriptional regulator [Brachybacterium sp. FME24]|uniref:MerR family transcriptional regulator n=1 Tax=Brachybacterium sp. FME24 TaxID=2742605 RepID=UPI001867323F|nr:MerR family transcriptional regulator [Brachybacterium sp. FME24]